MDIPGGASLPPGLPVEGTPDQIADYLKSKSIRFLMFPRDLRGAQKVTHVTFLEKLEQLSSMYVDIGNKSTIFIDLNIPQEPLNE
jgi:hypothetical protein